jgi:transposase
MKHYIGLDVSLKSTSVCIVDEGGKIIYETEVLTEPEIIINEIKQTGLMIEKIAIESGGTSHWLVKALLSSGLPAICIDARKMAAAISMRTNKTDKNDAREIANALRTGYYREVHLKAETTVAQKTLLTVRRALIDQRTDTINRIRGLLRLQGKLDCGNSQNHMQFTKTVREVIVGMHDEIKLSIESLLIVFTTLCQQITKIDDKIELIVAGDEVVNLFKTIPGVGTVTAFTYKLEIDSPSRFKKSRSVGAYIGMTPRQYSSGETTRRGGVSKTGSSELRHLLADAALCIIYRTKTWSCLKLFGMKIKRKHGHKKAIVALGRKLAVTMHRMWVTGKPFEAGRVEQKDIQKAQEMPKKEKKKAKALAVA